MEEQIISNNKIEKDLKSTKNEDKKNSLLNKLLKENESKNINKGLKDDGFIENISEQTNSKNYTSLTNTSNDCKTVRILKQLASGLHSEFTDTARYSFQHLITKMSNLALSNDLELISIVEMKHLELLGSAIISFGGVPKYTGANGNFWSAKFVDYNTDINTFLKRNILAEEKAIQIYSKAIDMVSNQSLKKLLEEIIQDEKEHIVIFNSYLK